MDSDSLILLQSFILIIALCLPHTVSETGLYPCIPCPPNHYQPEYGETKCIICTNDSPRQCADIQPSKLYSCYSSRNHYYRNYNYYYFYSVHSFQFYSVAFNFYA